MEKCKFCDTEAQISTSSKSSELICVDCPMCGPYELTRSANWVPINISKDDKMLLSGYIFNNSTYEKPLSIDTAKLKELPDLIAPYKSIPIDNRVNLIIRFIAMNTKRIGAPVVIRDKYNILYCKDAGELKALISWMEELEFVKWHSPGYSVSLEIEGWRRYDRLKEINPKSKKVFVAMSFNKDLGNIFVDAIQPACKECGYDAVRVDSEEHNKKICDKIISDIKESRFIISDFTQQKHGVYFEAGYAQGLGLEVIKTCKKGEENDLHFDTRQYNHIIWEDAADLRKQLANRIKATIG